jgi:membrane-associated protease RseP (regulator of RpoE activity)
LVDLLTRFQEFMDQNSADPWLLYLVGMLVAQALAITLHEAGHAIVAARCGAQIYEIAAAPEGPALRFRLAGVPVRIGLGLTRDGRSREPLGWVDMDTSTLTVEQYRRVLLAGPVTVAAGVRRRSDFSLRFRLRVVITLISGH